jgi:hypothetical protein
MLPGIQESRNENENQGKKETLTGGAGKMSISYLTDTVLETTC